MFGMNGFGQPGDMMFIHNTLKENTINYAIEAIGMCGYDLERCLDYGYEMANTFPEDFTDDENNEIYDTVKERYDDYNFN